MLGVKSLGAAIALSLVAAIAVSAPAAAASPQGKYSDPNAITIRIVEHQTGNLDAATAARVGAKPMTITPAATACKYAYWIAEARNVLNIVLFQYKEEVDWCENGTYIVGTPSRFTTPITPKPWVWAFVGEQLFDPSSNSSNPATISSMTYKARGQFAQYAYPYPWPVAYSYPMVSITVRGNGTASGSISW